MCIYKNLYVCGMCQCKKQLIIYTNLLDFLQFSFALYFLKSPIISSLGFFLFYYLDRLILVLPFCFSLLLFFAGYLKKCYCLFIYILQTPNIVNLSCNILKPILEFVLQHFKTNSYDIFVSSSYLLFFFSDVNCIQNVSFCIYQSNDLKVVFIQQMDNFH